MAGYRTAEYRHLLAAERALSETIESPGEHDSVSSLATALVRVIDQKRIMRGQPAPKPADVTSRNTTAASYRKPRIARTIELAEVNAPHVMHDTPSVPGTPPAEQPLAEQP